ncbi:4-hydroxyphenylpyruvate dioxygenase [Micromonospora sp. CPCC 206061]|uniref:4-hydroxyphenylpyruvate dioxygenase n=1 Tax=Micromonospora sp. CPCC 206061 TaxID=3122410 RepID=UPI002FF0D9AF
MDISTVDHVEFQVGDIEATARLLCTGYGFGPLGEGELQGQRSVLLGQGGIRVLLTAGPTGYVRRHGDGLATIALRTSDAAAAYAEAVTRGAHPVAPPAAWRRDDSVVVTATVGGPGALSHRFVERRGDGFLPGGIAETGEPPAGPLLEIDHAALCVPDGDLGPTVRYYEEVFGFKQIFSERVEIGGSAMESMVVQSPSGAVTFTIVAPDPVRRSGQLDDFLRANDGAGVQHLALSTADITESVASLKASGVRFLSTPDSYYEGIKSRLGAIGRPVEALRAGGILVDRDHWGEMFQIFTESPFERRTFFFELIERHGALTFGSNNIRALYEAKERSRAAAEARA